MDITEELPGHADLQSPPQTVAVWGQGLDEQNPTVVNGRAEDVLSCSILRPVQTIASLKGPPQKRLTLKKYIDRLDQCQDSM